MNSRCTLHTCSAVAAQPLHMPMTHSGSLQTAVGTSTCKKRNSVATAGTRMSIRRNVQFKDPELTRLFAVFDKAVVTHLGIASANLNAACARVERKVNDLAAVVR